MGLFNVFKGNKTFPRIDFTWQNKQSKLQGCVDFLSKNKVDICIAWFDDTYNIYQNIINKGLNKNLRIEFARTLFPYSLDNKVVLFLEHYPLYSKEENLVGKSKASKVYFINALDDALLGIFGGNLNQVMQKMGMAENECLEHKMISRSIINAQKKVEKEVWTDYSAKSGEDWARQFKANTKQKF
jgi:hypothetical protein